MIKFERTRQNLEEINNRAVQDVDGMIEASEIHYKHQVRAIADQIAAAVPSCRVVMLSGPSSSGKTTTTHLIRDVLEKKNVHSFVLSLDNFYLPRGSVPKDANGTPDFETINALNVDAICRCVESLIHEGTCMVPEFDFIAGDVAATTPVSLGQGDVLLVEGIHALNPVFVSHMEDLKLYRLYVSVRSEIYDSDGRVLFTPYDIRLIRRLIRDYQHRGSTPENTLSMWHNVCAGEMNYITPYKQYAHLMVNSFHDYELGAFRDAAMSLLDQIPQNSPEYEMGRELSRKLGLVRGFSPEKIPSESMLREFWSKKI